MRVSIPTPTDTAADIYDSFFLFFLDRCMHVLWLHPSNCSIFPHRIANRVFLHDSLTFGTTAYFLTGEDAFMWRPESGTRAHY